MQLGKVHQARILKHQLEGTPAPPELYQAALDAFARADTVAKGDARAQSESARVLAAWPGHREQALAAHRGAIETAKRVSDAEARVFAAKAFDDHARGQRDLALRRESLREVVEADPEDYEAWEDLVVLSDGQPVPRGEEVCRELISRRGDDPRSHRLYANYLLRKKRPADAIAHLERALEGEAAAPILWGQLIDLQLRNNQIDQARDSFDEMSDDFSDDPATRAAEARIALAEGKIAEGAEILRKLAESNESAESLRMLAVAEHRLGDLPAAVAAIERAIALAPGSLELYRLKTSIDYDAKNWAKLLRAYRVLAGRGQRLSTGDDLRRAHALYELGNRDAGRAVLEQVIAQPERRRCRDRVRAARRRDTSTAGALLAPERAPDRAALEAPPIGSRRT